MVKYSFATKEIKFLREEAVPYVFTSHQMDLIEKKAKGAYFQASEKVEFSRSISKKLRILSHFHHENNNLYVYGEEKTLAVRKKLAITYLKKFARRFRGKHIIIGGSFLYTTMFNDIDIFVVSKYEKEDHKEGKFHITFLKPSVYSSLLFASLAKLCVSNQKIELNQSSLSPNPDAFIALYQELCFDLDKHPHSVKSTLRDFLLHAALVSARPIPDSRELHKTINTILHADAKMFTRYIFVQSILLHPNVQQTQKTMRDLINSYTDLALQYPAYVVHYNYMIDTLREVLNIGKPRF